MYEAIRNLHESESSEAPCECKFMKLPVRWSRPQREERRGEGANPDLSATDPHQEAARAKDREG
ncbi:hypothetical protein E2C01_062994 [Portunus trituberculatus]|uniref:Uncharacterized protein n=1 Tax=Portunus trituberculatus TaxID=210409 RepID=A0A5B7HJM0_PORTR|nr:hypothetical protein [Portunus trituberculatus]